MDALWFEGYYPLKIEGYTTRSLSRSFPGPRTEFEALSEVVNDLWERHAKAGYKHKRPTDDDIADAYRDYKAAEGKAIEPLDILHMISVCFIKLNNHFCLIGSSGIFRHLIIIACEQTTGPCSHNVTRACYTVTVTCLLSHNCSLQRLSFSARLEKYKDTPALGAAAEKAEEAEVDPIEKALMESGLADKVKKAGAMAVTM